MNIFFDSDGNNHALLWVALALLILYTIFANDYKKLYRNNFFFVCKMLEKITFCVFFLQEKINNKTKKLLNPKLSLL